MTAAITDNCQCYSVGDSRLARNPRCRLHGDARPDHDDPTPHLLHHTPNGARMILAETMPNGDEE